MIVKIDISDLGWSQIFEHLKAINLDIEADKRHMIGFNAEEDTLTVKFVNQDQEEKYMEKQNRAIELIKEGKSVDEVYYIMKVAYPELKEDMAKYHIKRLKKYLG